jgi:hypothetical protein
MIPAFHEQPSRMNFIHVLMINLLTIGCVLLELLILHAAGFDLRLAILPLLAAVPALGAAVLLAWRICRSWGIFPLFIFAPRCPHYGERPPAWGCFGNHRVFRERLPRSAVLVCGLCRKEVRLWFQTPPAAAVDSFPNYELRPPKFLGIWRRPG